MAKWFIFIRFIRVLCGKILDSGIINTYYLEIDAPAGCITLSGPAPVQPTPAPDEDSPDAEPPTPAAPVTPVPSDTTTPTTSE